MKKRKDPPPPMIAVDPGDVHVGVSYFDGTGKCRWAREFGPLGFLIWLNQYLPILRIGVLVVERYQLYPNKAAQQHGSDMLTSQLIGAIRWIGHQHGIPVVQQQAALKVPTESLINHRGVERKSLGEGGHAKDAETHGHCYLWKTRLENRELP